MYGHMLLGLGGFIQHTFGEEVWSKSLKDAGLEYDNFFTYEVYGDGVFYQILEALCNLLDRDIDSLLFDFGYYTFSVYWHHSKHDTLLYGLGEDLHELVQSLNALHHHLSAKYDKMVAPSFTCDVSPEGLLVHYYSCRPQLGEYVKGILIGVASNLYRLNVSVDILDYKELSSEIPLNHYYQLRVCLKGDRDENTLSRLQGCKHKKKAPKKIGKVTANFHVAITKDLDECSPTLTPIPPEVNSEDWPINPDLFGIIAPFHLIFDYDLNIVSMGLAFVKLFGKCMTDVYLGNLFSIEFPTIMLSYQNILKEKDALFILTVKDEYFVTKEVEARPGFRGQMYPMSSNPDSLILFLASPSANSFKGLERMGFNITDIGKVNPLHELLENNNYYNPKMDLSGQLEKAKHQLGVEKAEVDRTKGYTDNILHGMLPVQVANDLKTNGQVLPREFPQVSILFTAISNFQAICKKSTAHEVVVLLNGLFTRFDNLIEIHRVYKVETVGDSYMMTAGFPDTAERHAEAVTNMAFDMRKEITKLNKEAQEHELEIVIGIHSGPVVTGVIGTTQPRYCLFGDTVNTASRMNSTGEPGKIHISESTYDHIKNDIVTYFFVNRGKIFVKGLGLRTTYFVEDQEPREETQSVSEDTSESTTPPVANDAKPESASSSQQQVSLAEQEILALTKVPTESSSSSTELDSSDMNQKTTTSCNGVSSKSFGRKNQIQPISPQETQPSNSKPVVNETNAHHRKNGSNHRCQLM